MTMALVIGRDSDQPRPAHVPRSRVCRADPNAEPLRRCSLAGAAVGLALLVLLVYWPTLSSEFVGLDDYQYVVDNTLVRDPSWNSLRRFFVEVRTPSTVNGYYQPLTMTSLMLDAWLSGPPALNPFALPPHQRSAARGDGGAGHAFRPDVRRRRGRAHAGGRLIRPAPDAGRVRRLDRPTQDRAVHAAGRRLPDLLPAPSPRRPGPLADGVGGAVRHRRLGQADADAPAARPAAARHLAAKGGLGERGETTVGRTGWRPALRRVVAGLPGKLPFLVCMAAMMWVSWVSQASSAARLLAPNVSSAEVLARLAGLICYNLMLYLGNIFWPLHLSPYRDLPADLSLTSPAIAASVVATLAFLTVCVLAYRRSRPLFVGGIAFLILLAPALGAVRFVETCVADRFLYLPSVFLTLALAALLVRMEVPSRRRATTLRAGFALLAVLLAALTWKQQAVWHDSRALWIHIVRTAPGLPKGHAELAAADLEGGAFDSAGPRPTGARTRP